MKKEYNAPELTLYRFATETDIMDRPNGSGVDPFSLDDLAEMKDAEDAE